MLLQVLNDIIGSKDECTGLTAFRCNSPRNAHDASTERAPLQTCGRARRRSLSLLGSSATYPGLNDTDWISHAPNVTEKARRGLEDETE